MNNRESMEAGAMEGRELNKDTMAELAEQGDETLEQGYEEAANKLLDRMKENPEALVDGLDQNMVKMFEGEMDEHRELSWREFRDGVMKLKEFYDQATNADSLKDMVEQFAHDQFDMTLQEMLTGMRGDPIIAIQCPPCAMALETLTWTAAKSMGVELEESSYLERMVKKQRMGAEAARALADLAEYIPAAGTKAAFVLDTGANIMERVGTESDALLQKEDATVYDGFKTMMNILTPRDENGNFDVEKGKEWISLMGEGILDLSDDDSPEMLKDIATSMKENPELLAAGMDKFDKTFVKETE